MVELYPYQKTFYQDIRVNLAKHKRIIACAATGSGKTKVFIAISDAGIFAGRTILIVSESTKIFSQIKEERKCVEIGGGSNDIYIHPNRLYLAMAQTLARRKRMIEQFSKLKERLIIIVDEAHIGTATKLLIQFPNCLMIGFTATPDFRSAKHLPEIYKDIVVGPQPDQLVQLGYLSSYKHFQRKAANVADLKLKGGEFTEESQEFVFETKQVYDGLIEDLRIVPFKKCMVFTASIKHCRDVILKLTEAGFDCVEYHSKTEKSTASFNMKAFEFGDVNICVSVGSLTKGYDYKPVDLVILYRATTSLPLFLQMIGRGSRSLTGKDFFTVLDYGLNCDRHLPWDYERDWETMWNKPLKKKKEGVAPIKTCPKCDYIMAVSQTVCPNCGYQFVKQETKKIETELIEVTEKYRSLIGRKLSELTPQELATYAKAKNKKGFATVIARHHGIEFLKEFGHELNYKRGWEYFQIKIENRKPLEEIDYILR